MPMMKATLLSLLGLFLWNTEGRPLLDGLARVVTLPPSEDPFYTPTEGYERRAAGSILRHREIPYIDVKQKGARAHHILYRTNDNFGHATATVTTVLIPKNADFNRILSYQLPEDSPSIDCSPSYSIANPFNHGDLIQGLYSKIDHLSITSALERGWITVIPDFEGPNAAFLANTLAGHAVLDSIRAVRASGSFTGVASTAAIAMWGYSGGSLATGFAAELQPFYAPELNIVGAALGGVIGNITSTVTTINTGPFAGLISSGLHGLANAYPDIANLIAEQLVDDSARREKFMKAKRECLIANIEHFAFEDVVSYFKDPDFQNHPLIRKAQQENEMGEHTPTIPLLMYKATLDEISPVGDTELLASRYCANGVTLELREVALHEHILLGMDGFLEAIPWLSDRMDGVHLAPGCSQSTSIGPLSDPDAVNILGDTVRGGLLSVVHDII